MAAGNTGVVTGHRLEHRCVTSLVLVTGREIEWAHLEKDHKDGGEPTSGSGSDPWNACLVHLTPVDIAQRCFQGPAATELIARIGVIIGEDIDIRLPDSV